MNQARNVRLPCALNELQNGGKDFTFGIARNCTANRPTAQKASWSWWIETKLIEPRIGPKDGEMIHCGQFAGKKRAKAAVKSMSAFCLDFDSGRPFDEVADAFRATGKAGVMYTTHSHLTKDGLWVPLDKLMAHAGIDDRNPTDAECAAYLSDVKGFAENVASSAIATGQRRIESDRGVEFLISHPPVEKFRLMVPFDDPLDMAYDFLTARDGSAHYERRALGLAESLGGGHDRTTGEIGRVFYTAATGAPDAPFRAEVFDGPFLRFEEAPLADPPRRRGAASKAKARRQNRTAMESFAGWSDEEDDREFYTPGGVNLKRWAYEYSGTFLIADAVRDSGCELRSDDGHDRCSPSCPFEDDHTEPGGAGFFVANADEHGFVAHCQHDHCKERDRLEFLAGLIEDGALSEADLFSDQYHLETSEKETA